MSKPKQCRKYNTFAQRLKAARLKSGISQKHLAERVGIRSATLSAYENADAEKRITPSLENAVALAKTLGVSLDYLCGIDSSEIEKSAVDEIREYLYMLTRTIKLFPKADQISVCFPSESAVCSFLKGWTDVWKAYRSGALDNEIYDSVVKTLCDKYAPLVVKEQHIEEGKVND